MSFKMLLIGLVIYQMEAYKLVEANRAFLLRQTHQQNIQSSPIYYSFRRNSYAYSLITQVLQGLDQFYHLHGVSLLELRASAFIPAVDSMLGLHMIEVNNFILQNLVDHEVEYIVEINHITAKQTGRQFAQQLVVLATLTALLDQSVQGFLLLQLAQLQVQQVHLPHTVLISQFEDSVRCVIRHIDISLGRLINIHLLDVLLIQLFLHLLDFPFLSSLLPQSNFLLAENTFKLRRRKKTVFESHLLLLLLVQLVVLIEIVIDTHVTAEVDGWQITLQGGLLGQSVQVACAFSRVEKGMVC